MIKFRTASFYVLALLLFAGCSNLFDNTEHLDLEKDFREVSAADFAIKIPRYLTEDRTLHATASLQYANEAKELFLIVLEEPKDTLLQSIEASRQQPAGYRLSRVVLDAQMTDFKMNSEIEEGYVVSDTLINGMEASRAEISMFVPALKVKVAYFVACVVGERHVYRILCWTPQGNADKYRETCGKIAHSFRVTGK